MATKVGWCWQHFDVGFARGFLAQRHKTKKKTGQHCHTMKEKTAFLLVSVCGEAYQLWLTWSSHCPLFCLRDAADSWEAQWCALEDTVLLIPLFLCVCNKKRHLHWLLSIYTHEHASYLHVVSVCVNAFVIAYCERQPSTYTPSFFRFCLLGSRRISCGLVCLFSWPGNSCRNFALFVQVCPKFAKTIIQIWNCATKTAVNLTGEFNSL